LLLYWTELYERQSVKSSFILKCKFSVLENLDVEVLRWILRVLGKLLNRRSQFQSERAEAVMN
jgi:hypothetical protein